LHFWCRRAVAISEPPPRSLHDALPIYPVRADGRGFGRPRSAGRGALARGAAVAGLVAGRASAGLRLVRARQFLDLRPGPRDRLRSEEHTSELQPRANLVCRPLLEKNNI